MLKQAGYATGHCGKWRQVGASPGDWGFDEFITDPTASGWYWKTSYTKNGKEVQTEKEIYYPAVCHEFALDFIERHSDQPFFVEFSDLFPTFAELAGAKMPSGFTFDGRSFAVRRATRASGSSSNWARIGTPAS